MGTMKFLILGYHHVIWALSVVNRTVLGLVVALIFLWNL